MQTRPIAIAVLALLSWLPPVSLAQEIPTIYETYTPYAPYNPAIDSTWVSVSGWGPGWGQHQALDRKRVDDAREAARRTGSGAHGFPTELRPDPRVASGAHGFPVDKPRTRPHWSSALCAADPMTAGMCMSGDLQVDSRGQIDSEATAASTLTRARGAVVISGGVASSASVGPSLAWAQLYNFGPVMTAALIGGTIAGEIKMWGGMAFPQAQVPFAPVDGAIAGIMELPGTGGARVVSPVLSFEGLDGHTREILVVQLDGGETQGFYRSTGENSRKPGAWLPFDGMHPDWVDKARYGEYNGYPKGDPNYRYGPYRTISFALQEVVPRTDTSSPIRQAQVNYFLDAYDALKVQAWNPRDPNLTKFLRPLIPNGLQGFERREQIDRLTAPRPSFKAR